MQVFRNNFSSMFLDPVAGSPSAHQIRIARDAAGSLDAPLAPGDFYLLTAFRVVNGREVDVEVMKATSITVAPGAYTLTVERAQEQAGQATIARAFGVGDFIEARFTAGAAQRMLQADDNLRTLGNPDLALNNLGVSSIGLALLKATSVAQVIALLGLEGNGGTPIPPSILVQPQPTSVVQGANAVFSLTAIGEALEYQWMREGEDIPGATQASYTVLAAALGDNGVSFSCRVSNAAGETVSAAAQLTVTAGAVLPGQVTSLAPGAATQDTQPLTWAAPAIGTAPFTYQVAFRLGSSSGAYTDFGSPTADTTLTVTGLSAGTAYDYRVTPINAAGAGTPATLNDVPTASPGGQPITTFLANAVQGQWVRENIVQNTRDRGTTGDYYMVGTATNSGYFQVVKRLPDGTFSAPVTLNPNPYGPAESDDHNVPALLQLPSGRWLAVWNRHGIAGATGFRYAITATPHGMDFGTPVVVTGSATWNGGTAASTYTQVYLVGDRVILFYRVGGSQNGSWVCRYSNNIGATTPTWSAEFFVTPTAYMDSAIAADGVTLRCAMYDHPWNTLSHNVFTFDVNLSTGDMVAAGSSTVIGNVFTNTSPVENSAARQAVTITTGTSRLFNIDAAGNLYAMEMAGGNGSTTWPSGTYYRYVRTSSGVYTKQIICETGLPFLGGQQGYYGSICRLDDNRVLVSVNTGASVGVGSWELREYVTNNGGTSWSLDTTHIQTSAIVMRPQVINNLMFWYEATAYATYTNFTASGKFRLSTTAVFTPRASVPAGTDPAPSTPPSLSGSPGAATVGTPYNFVPAVSGGTGPFSFALTGTLPAGLNFNTSTGAITGTPTTAGTTSGLNITVTDSASQSAPLGAFSLTVNASSGFAAVAAHTLTKLTSIGNNQYQAANDAGSQGGILYTGQKAAANTTFALRGAFNHEGASYIIGIGTSTLATSASTAQERCIQIQAGGGVQYSISGGTAVSLGFTFAARSANNLIEVYRDTDMVIKVRVSENGGASWSPLGSVSTALAGEVQIRCYCSYSSSVTPNNRVIDNVTQTGLVAV